jgi:phosphonate transport system substrate-binding protein
MMRWLAAVAICCFAAYSHAEPGGEVYTFGITPQHSPGELGKLWVPICQYLSKQTGYTIQFRTSKDLSTYWKDANEGVYDLLYINPPRYVEAHDTSGYEAFAKDGDTPLVGIVIARKDGPQRLKELNGQKLAVPSLVSLGAAEIPQAYLRQQGIKVTLVAVGSHDSVYRTVAKGLYPAGGSNQRIFGMLDRATQEQFRVLWKTEPLPPFAFAAHPRVPLKVVERIRQVLVEMSNNPEGRALLAAINVKFIVPAKNRDYDSMRKMKLPMN